MFGVQRKGKSRKKLGDSGSRNDTDMHGLARDSGLGTILHIGGGYVQGITVRTKIWTVNADDDDDDSDD